MPLRPRTAKANPLASLGGPFPTGDNATFDPYSPSNLSDVAIASLIATDPARISNADAAATRLADVELHLTRQEINSSFTPANPLGPQRAYNPFNSQYQKLFQETPTLSLHDRISSASLFASTTQIASSTSISTTALPLPPGLTTEDLAFLTLRTLPDSEPLAASPIPLPFGSSQSLAVANADALAVALVTSASAHKPNTLSPSPSAAALVTDAATGIAGEPAAQPDADSNVLLRIQPTLSSFDPPAHTSSVHLPAAALTLHQFAALLTLVNALASPPSQTPPAVIPQCPHPASLLRANRRDTYSSALPVAAPVALQRAATARERDGHRLYASASGASFGGEYGNAGTGSIPGTPVANNENGFARNGQWISQYITPSTVNAPAAVPLAPLLVLPTSTNAAESSTGIRESNGPVTLTNSTSTTPSIDALLSTSHYTSRTGPALFSPLPLAAHAAVAADRAVAADEMVAGAMFVDGVTYPSQQEPRPGSRARGSTRGTLRKGDIHSGTGRLPPALTAPARPVPPTARVRPLPLSRASTQRLSDTIQRPADATEKKDAEKHVPEGEHDAVGASDSLSLNVDHIPPENEENEKPVTEEPTHSAVAPTDSATASTQSLLTTPIEPTPLSSGALVWDAPGSRWLSSSLFRQYILLPALAQDTPLTRAIAAVWTTLHETAIPWVPVDSFLAMILTAALPWLQCAMLAASPAHLLSPTAASTSASASVSVAQSLALSPIPGSPAATPYPTHDGPLRPLPWLRTLHANLALAPFLRISALAFPAFAYAAAASTHTLAHATHDQVAFDPTSASAVIPSTAAARMLHAVPALPTEASVLVHPFAFLPLLLRRACLSAARDLLREREETVVTAAHAREKAWQESKGRLRDVRAVRARRASATEGDSDNLASPTEPANAADSESGGDAINAGDLRFNRLSSDDGGFGVGMERDVQDTTTSSPELDISVMAASLAESLCSRLSLSHRTHSLYATKLARIVVDLFAQHRLNVKHALVEERQEREQNWENDIPEEDSGRRSEARRKSQPQLGRSTTSRPNTSLSKHQRAASGGWSQHASTRTRTMNSQSNGRVIPQPPEEYVLKSSLRPIVKPASAAVPQHPATVAVAAMNRRRTQRAKTAATRNVSTDVWDATASVAATSTGISEKATARAATASPHLAATLRGATAISGRSLTRPLTRVGTARITADTASPRAFNGTGNDANEYDDAHLQPLLRPSSVHPRARSANVTTLATPTATIPQPSPLSALSPAAASPTAASPRSAGTLAATRTASAIADTRTPTLTSSLTESSMSPPPRPAQNDPLASHAFLSSFGFASVPDPEQLATIDTAPPPAEYDDHVRGDKARNISNVPLSCLLDALVPMHSTLTAQQHDPAPPLGLLFPSSVAQETVTDPATRTGTNVVTRPKTKRESSAKSPLAAARDLMVNFQYGLLNDQMNETGTSDKSVTTKISVLGSDGVDVDAEIESFPLERNPYHAISAAYDREIIGASYACLAQVFGSRPGLSLRLKQCLMYYAREQAIANAEMRYRQQYASFARVRMAAISKMLAYREGEADNPYLSDEDSDDDNFYDDKGHGDYYEQQQEYQKQRNKMRLDFTSQLGYGQNVPVLTQTAQILNNRTKIVPETSDFDAEPFGSEVSPFPSVSPRTQPTKSSYTLSHAHLKAHDDGLGHDEHSWRPTGGLPPLPLSDLPPQSHDDGHAKTGHDRLSTFNADDNYMNAALPVPPQCGWRPSEQECLQQRLTCAQVFSALADAERAVARDDALFMTRVLVYLCDAQHTEDREWLLTVMHPNNVGAVVSSVTLRGADQRKVDVAVDVYAEAKSQVYNLLDRAYTEEVAERLQHFLEDHVIVKAVVELTKPSGSWRVEEDDGLYDGTFDEPGYVYDDDEEEEHPFSTLNETIVVGADDMFPLPGAEHDAGSVDGVSSTSADQVM